MSELRFPELVDKDTTTNSDFILRFRKLFSPEAEMASLLSDTNKGGRSEFVGKLDPFLVEFVAPKLPDRTITYAEMLDFIAAEAHGLIRRDPLFYNELAKLALYAHIRDEVDSNLFSSGNPDQEKMEVPIASFSPVRQSSYRIVAYLERMNRHRHPHDPETRVPLIRDDVCEKVLHSKGLIKRVAECLVKHGPEMVRRMDFAGMTIITEKYLKRDRSTNALIETPELMMVRVALECWHREPYDCSLLLEYLLLGKISMASPVYFNACSVHPQMASCFLLEMADSMDGIYETMKRVALLSKEAGGIGMSLSPLRGKGAYIAGTDGWGKGSTAVLPQFEETMIYSDQGGGKRKGAGATYKDISHIDTWEYLKMALAGQCDKKFYGLFIPDLFFRRVEQGGDWTMFCPKVIAKECMRLYRLHGVEFEREYLRLEQDPVAMKRSKVVPAKVLLDQIVDVAMETRLVYACAKDRVNAWNMQQNVGPVITSNLCTEIYQVTKPDWVATCNLASVIVSAFITEYGTLDHVDLRRACEIVTRTANHIIDITYYPVKQARKCNKRMRPIGIGMIGLADAIQATGKEYDSPEGVAFCRDVVEAIQYNCLRESYKRALVEGRYPEFEGSPYAGGIFHHELWATTMDVDSRTLESGTYDWNKLRDGILNYGLRNSNVVALMPTASSSIIAGKNEAFYGGYPSNMYTRKTNAGDRIIINRGMFLRLKSIGCYTPDILARIFRDKGIISRIEEIPEDVRAIYRTLHELSGKSMIRACAAMQPFVCQGISMSAHIHYDRTMKAEERLEHGKMVYRSFLVEAWKAGCATLSYYPRSDTFTEANDYGTVRAAMKSSSSGKKEEEEDDSPDDDGLIRVEGNKACTSGACEA